MKRVKHTAEFIEFSENYHKGAAPFYKNLKQAKAIMFNGTAILQEEYKLVISTRDFALYSSGLKPHRRWSFNSTKKYYGLKGHKGQVLTGITNLLTQFNKFKKMYVKSDV